MGRDPRAIGLTRIPTGSSGRVPDVLGLMTPGGLDVAIDHLLRAAGTPRDCAQPAPPASVRRPPSAVKLYVDGSAPFGSGHNPRDKAAVESNMSSTALLLR